MSRMLSGREQVVPVLCTSAMPANVATGLRTFEQTYRFRCTRLPRRTECRAEPQLDERSAKDIKTGFRWDPAMSRWVQDDRVAGKVDASIVIKPKSGPAYTVWPAMWSDLVDYKLESVSPSQALAMLEDGWTIIDVRAERNFNFAHISGSVSIPLYQDVQGNTMMDNVKRLAMASFAMRATERDPEFANKVVERFGADAKLIVACDIGGTLNTITEVKHKKKDYDVKDPERAFGRESRSLKAAHALISVGCCNIAHLEGGIQQWKFQGFEME